MESQLLDWAFGQGPVFVILAIIVWALYRREQANEEREQQSVATMQAYWEERVEDYSKRTEDLEREMIAVQIRTTEAIVKMTSAIDKMTEAINRLDK